MFKLGDYTLCNGLQCSLVFNNDKIIRLYSQANKKALFNRFINDYSEKNTRFARTYNFRLGLICKDESILRLTGERLGRFWGLPVYNNMQEPIDNGFILCNYPKNIIGAMRYNIDNIIELEINENEYIDFYKNFKKCPNCFNEYNIKYHKLSNNLCDRCGNKLENKISEKNIRKYLVAFYNDFNSIRNWARDLGRYNKIDINIGINKSLSIIHKIMTGEKVEKDLIIE